MVVIMRWTNHQRTAVSWTVNGRVTIATDKSTLHSTESNCFEGLRRVHTWKEQKTNGELCYQYYLVVEPQSAGHCCVAEISSGYLQNSEGVLNT